MVGPLRGPEFGSYPAESVGWLLTDISRMALEAPLEEREEAIQAGTAHYSESLPVEYQPTEDYYALYEAMVEEHAEALAHQTAIVGEKLWALRGPKLVLASLARAGVPIGILLREYFKKAHGVEVPHYAVSIVRGKGLDPVAMEWLAAHHAPAEVVWVDGWTGKGAITRELAQAVSAYNQEAGTDFSSTLAVLADPGEAVSIFGTREDYLIPSACLNSTVSGLISRTVANEKLLAPGEFHGAKFYREFQDHDVSNAFIKTVAAYLPGMPLVLSPEEAQDGTVTFAGWRQVEALAKAYGIPSVNLVKPGVGETTRVLLRRKPERVLVKPGKEEALKHILLLCEERGIPVEAREDLVYSCVGLISPLRGTGFDGRAVAAQEG